MAVLLNLNDAICRQKKVLAKWLSINIIVLITVRSITVYTRNVSDWRYYFVLGARMKSMCNLRIKSILSLDGDRV